MVYQGDWSSGDEGTPDNMNSLTIQRDVIGSRPATAKAGVLFYATDENKLYRDNGAGWDEIDLSDLAVGVGSKRTLGAGATQAAAGNHSHAPTHDTIGADGDYHNVDASDILQTTFNMTAATEVLQLSTVNITPDDLTMVEAVGGAILMDGDGSDFYLKLYIDGTVVATSASIPAAWTAVAVSGNKAQTATATIAIALKIYKIFGGADDVEYVASFVGAGSVKLV